jgi:hypothetical protein
VKRLLWMVFLLYGPGTLWLRAQAAPDGTPERAIQDLALASKAEQIEKHLPLATLEAAKTLAAEDRQAFDAGLTANRPISGPQSSIAIPEDGHAFLVVQNDGSEQLAARLTDSVVTGADAVLRFAVDGTAPVSMDVTVWMRYEDGEWRIRELDTGNLRGRIRFDDPEFVERFRDRLLKQNESNTMTTLYTLNYALHRYADSHPEIGFPDDLALLAEPVSLETDDEAASYSFLGADLAQNDFVRDGYHIRYVLIHGGPQGSYRITACPADPAKGRFSYFLDESGDIRQTSGDRQATSDDPPLNSQ